MIDLSKLSNSDQALWITIGGVILVLALLLAYAFGCVSFGSDWARERWRGAKLARFVRAQAKTLLAKPNPEELENLLKTRMDAERVRLANLDSRSFVIRSRTISILLLASSAAVLIAGGIQIWHLASADLQASGTSTAQSMEAELGRAYDLPGKLNFDKWEHISTDGLWLLDSGTCPGGTAECYKGDVLMPDNTIQHAFALRVGDLTLLTDAKGVELPGRVH